MKLKLAIALALSSLLCQAAYSQSTESWLGILDPSRAINWSGAGIPGGIPARTTICQTVAPSGLTDGTDMNAIDNAIASCPANQVVQLEAGTYTITGGLTFGTVSNVTLRGAGPDKTKLVFTGLGTHECGANAEVCVYGNAGWSNRYAGSHQWTAGYSRGSTVLTLDSTSGLSVGQIIILDQRNDAIGMVASPNGATESGSTVTITTSIPHGYSVGQTIGIGTQTGGGALLSGYEGSYTITAVPTSTTFQYTDSNTGLAASGGGFVTADTGGVFVSDVIGPVTDEGGPIGRSCPDTSDPSCASGEISWRSQAEVKQITAISGDQITISPALYMPNWRSSQAPGIWWTGTTYDVLDGIEGLTLDYTNDGGVNDNGGIMLYRTYECWVRDVRSINGNRNHIWIREGSARDEVVDSYFFGGNTGAATDYGIEVYEASEDDLIQNNICQHVVACIMVGGDWGSVYGYNYAIDSGATQTDWLYPLMSENHDSEGYDLFEGNDVPFASLDNVHGNSNAATTFRNRLRGQDTPLKTNSLLATSDYAFNRFNNFIGNVMGTVGAETAYVSTAVAPSGYIWDLDAQSEHYNVPNDPLVTSTLLRWGNYDVVTGAVRWCGNSSDPGWTTTCASTSEIPTSSFTYMNGNPVPSSTSLPASFYLSTQPAFWKTAWGTPPWPAVGPDVTGGTAPDGLNGMSYAIPAQLCYVHTPADPAYQQSFAVTGAAWSSSASTATLTIGSNTLVTGSVVTVSGVNPSGYDGVFGVASETGTTISYYLPTNPGAYASGGTATYPNILLFNAANCYPADYGNSPSAPTDLTATAH